MKKHHLYLGFVLIVVAIFYSPLLHAFYQQDEWFAFGTYYRLSNHSFFDLFLSSFAPNVGHYIPLYFLSFYSFAYLFGTSFVLWQIVSIVWHLAITAGIYFLLVKLFDDQRLSLLGASVFGLSGSAHQATSWVVADTNTHGAALFGVLSLIFILFSAEREKTKTRFIVLSILMFFISLLFKETTVAVFVCIPLLYTIFKKGTFKKSSREVVFPWLISGVIYACLRGIMFLLPQSKNSASVATQSQSIGEIFQNMVTFPAKAFFQGLVPSKWIQKGTESVLGRLHITGGNDVHTTGFAQYVSGMLEVVFILGFILIVFYFIRMWLKNRENRNLQIILYSIIFISVNSVIFALSPERRGIITFLDSRNLYFTLVGSVIFLVAVIKQFQPNQIFKKLFPFFLGGLFLLNISAGILDFKDLVAMSSSRKNILTQVNAAIPQNTDNMIIFVQSDSTYYGLPDTQKIVPFQSGFGQTLLVYLNGKGNFPVDFYESSVLWPITSEGYLEKENHGFGYYRNYDLLLTKVADHSISVENVYSFYWKGRTEALINVTDEIRTKIQKDLKKN